MKNNVKVIFHIDMNAFFASCELIKRPYLADKPFAIGPRITKKGVLSTANYVARQYGVHSAMSVVEAMRKCPNLIIIDGEFSLYREYSKKFMDILEEYDVPLEKASIDEAFMDVTSLNNYLDLAKTIQKRIFDEAKLPCSIGIGPTRFLAKMASDMKKPLGITVIRKRDIKEKLYPLDIGDFFGIGKKSVPWFNDLGIYKIGDLALKLEDIRSLLSEKNYQDIKKKLDGKSSDIVDSTRYDDLASIGHSHTALEDIVDLSDAQDLLMNLCNKVSLRAKKKNVRGRTITIQIKDPKLKSITRSRTIPFLTNDNLEIFDIIWDLFNDNWQIDPFKPIRLLGVSISNFIEEKKEINLFNLEPLEEEERINDVLKKMKEKYGDSIIKRGLK